MSPDQQRRFLLWSQVKSQQSDLKKRLKTLPVGPWRDGGARFHKSSLTTQDSFSTFSALQTFIPFYIPCLPSSSSLLRLSSSFSCVSSSPQTVCFAFAAMPPAFQGLPLICECVCACVLLLARRVPLCVSVCDEDTEVACQQRQEAFNQAANRLRSLPSV